MDESINTKDVVLDFLANHKKKLLERREMLARPLQEVDQEIEHVDATMRSLQRPAIPLGTTMSIRLNGVTVAVEDFPIAKLRKLTQVQALTVIAKHYGGTLKAQEAKRLLIRAGVMRETKNSTNIIHAVILRSDKFERVRPGEYRLKEVPEVRGQGTVFETPVQ